MPPLKQNIRNVTFLVYNSGVIVENQENQKSAILSGKTLAPGKSTCFDFPPGEDQIVIELEVK